MFVCAVSTSRGLCSKAFLESAPLTRVSSSELVVAFSISGSLIKNLVAVWPVIITQRCAHFPPESHFKSGPHV